MKTYSVISILFILLVSSCNSSNEIKIETEKNLHIQSQSIKEKTVEKIEPIGTGKITTRVDGMDVKKVNLWSKASSDRTIVCSLTNDEEVTILKDANPYYLVESTQDSACKGYCMKGFVIKK